MRPPASTAASSSVTSSITLSEGGADCASIRTVGGTATTTADKARASSALCQPHRRRTCCRVREDAVLLLTMAIACPIPQPPGRVLTLDVIIEVHATSKELWRYVTNDSETRALRGRSTALCLVPLKLARFRPFAGRRDCIDTYNPDPSEHRGGVTESCRRTAVPLAAARVVRARRARSASR